MDNTVLDYVLPGVNEGEEAKRIEEKLKQEEAKEAKKTKRTPKPKTPPVSSQNLKDRYAFKKDIESFRAQQAAERDKRFQEEVQKKIDFNKEMLEARSKENAKQSEAYQNLQRELQQRREEENARNREFRRELLEQKKNEAEDNKELQEERYKQESRNDLKQKAIDTFTEPFVDKIGTSFWDTIIKGV